MTSTDLNLNNIINPLDDLEDFLINHGWPYQRLDGSGIIIETGEEAQQYLLQCSFNQKERMLSVTCFLGIRGTKKGKYKILTKLNAINLCVNLGAFVCDEKTNDIFYRVEIPILGHTRPGEPIFEPIIETCLNLVEYFYPSIIESVSRSSCAAEENNLIFADYRNLAKA